jgi:glutamine synthetase
MIRIPGPGRIEVRVLDGAANPYLASGALLAAGLDGIENRIEPGPANSGNLYELSDDELSRRGIQYLPTNLREALQCLQDDAVVRDALGETYASYYIGVKSDEWDRYHRSISQWETDNYLKTY